MTTYCNEKEQDWWLWNHNYHQMVQVVVKIIQNTSLLRFDAPEWCPKGTMVSNDPDGICDEWKIPRRHSKGKTIARKVDELCESREMDENNVKNYYEVLSDDDEDQPESNVKEETCSDEKNKISVLAPPIRETAYC